jgi:hypothetical protein
MKTRAAPFFVDITQPGIATDPPERWAEEALTTSWLNWPLARRTALCYDGARSSRRPVLDPAGGASW